MAARLILDSGAVLAVARGNRTVVRLIEAARLEQVDVVVPPVVAAETLRGGGRDTPIYRLLQFSDVPPFGQQLARRAGALLARSGSSNVADAQVVAEALAYGPALILTGDLKDIQRLAQGESTLRVRPI